MANYKMQAINLKSYNLAESDKIIVMYSKEHGIVRCVAKGIKKPTSKLGGRMQSLMANKLLMASGKKLDIVCQAELIDSFKEIRSDINKLSYAIYCAELINNFGLENDTNSSQIYDLFFECLKNIALSPGVEDVLWTVIRFKMRFMKQLGYAVELNHCVRCNDKISENAFFFCAESGGVVCNNCKNDGYKLDDLDSNIIRIMKDAVNFDFPEFAVNKITLGYCFDLLKQYVSLRSHKKLKSSELIECLC
jgi:DNA repair protein RecO (recombination protein O)